MTLDPQRLKELFLAAADLHSAGERLALLDRECGSDVELRQQLEALLRAHDDSAGFPDAGDDAGPSEAPRPRAEDIGTRIGPYKLLQQIGEGGMGTVYMAEQEEPVHRHVALKIIKPGMDSQQIIARFEAERQALALMDHPNIAKVFDAGTAASGRPYFVMELVKGMPLTRFCDERRLGLRERLELAVPVCQAVQHAHQKGIIHRDIKPSNVLVALHDGRPVPKVIDFGLAKATGPKLTERTLFTAFGPVVGTLEYMAPEQAEVNQLDVDTRADIYSLGVLLYELLTGSTPLERGRLKKAALLEVLRLIREHEPPRPSVRLSSSHVLASVAALRGTEPAKLTKLVRGELDWIVMKCLEKDRERRYETANGLARDLQRYLADEPVQACPPSAGYRLRKFLRRHRGPVFAAGIVVLALVAGIVGTSVGLVRAWQAEAGEREQRKAAEQRRAEAEAARNEEATQRQQAARERDRAEKEKQIAEAVRTFLERDLLRQADATAQADALRLAGGGFEVKENPTIKELLDRAATGLARGKVEAKFPNQPEVQASILRTVGESYGAIGAYENAVEFLGRSSDIYRHAVGADHPSTLVTLYNLAGAYLQAGRTADAIRLFEQVREQQIKHPGLDLPGDKHFLHGLGMAYRFQGKFGEAAPLLEKALALHNQLDGEEHPNTLSAMNDLGLVYEDQGKYAPAAKLYEKILADCRRLRGETHPQTLLAMNRLASVYRNLDKDAQAEELCVKVLEIRRQVLGDEHPDTSSSRAILAGLYKRQGRFAEAEALDTKALEANRRVLGAEHPYTLTGRGNLANTYYVQGKYAQAEKLQRERLEASRRVLGPDHPDTLFALLGLGMNLRDQSRYADAAPLLTQALEGCRRKLGPEHAATLRAMQEVAVLEDEQAKLPEAEQHYAQLLAARRRGPSPDHPQVAAVLALSGRNLVKQGKYAQAEPLLREGLKISESKQPQKWDRFQCEALLGASLAGQKKQAEAEPLLLAGYEGMKTRKQLIPVPDRACLTEALKQLVKLYDAWGKKDEAARWRKELEAMKAPDEKPMP
jgi:serine/threonine protein kinase/tetratricopeptide (TPR) repeat protein